MIDNSCIVYRLYALILAYLGFIMASLIHFRAMPGKWLKSACSVLICGDLSLVGSVYDGIGVVGARVYPGMFTFYFSDFNVGKPTAVLSTCHPKISTPNQIYQERGYVSVQNIKSHIYGIPLYKYALS